MKTLTKMITGLRPVRSVTKTQWRESHEAPTVRRGSGSPEKRQRRDAGQPLARIGLVVVLVALGLGRSPPAHADTLLVASTDLVAGTSTATFSFNTTTSGTVTARLASLPWPVPLSALSFSATTATDTLTAWGGPGGDMSTPYIEQFQVGAGTYFAHVVATAGGDLNLGLYSLMLTFTPSAVPLPTAAGLLLIGLLVVFALRGTMRAPRNESVMYPA